LYRIVEGRSHSLKDVENFIKLLNKIDQHPDPSLRQLFEHGKELFVTRAPGRLDVMGGIADYSGSLVLQLPLHEATLVAIQRSAEKKIEIVSLDMEKNHSLHFKMPLKDFKNQGLPISYDQAREYFRRHSDSAWAAYVAGALLVLMREKNVDFFEGMRMLVYSNVPQGKGVSSSAALEVAAMQAIAAAFQVPIEPKELALLCQRVENLIVGAPCGVMDQMTAVFGEAHKLLALLCQPAELMDQIAIPREIVFWGIDSGERHTISGADYTSVRVGAFMGYRMIAEQTGLEVVIEEKTNKVIIKDPFWKGFLANITPSEFEKKHSQFLPEEITGEEFLRKYQNISDQVTQIDPSKKYRVLVPTRHPVYEHFRVKTFAELFKDHLTDQRLELLGELMYQSHASYSACGLGSPGTDRLVELVREAGPEKGLFGAKITGGGSGGTVAVIGKPKAQTAIDEIVECYTKETGYRPKVFKDSSTGAARFGYLKLIHEF